MDTSLDRFAQGLPDPQEQEPQPVKNCINCGFEIYEDDEYFEFPSGEISCFDVDCLAAIGEATRKTA